MSEEDEEAAAEDAEVEGEDSFEKQYQDALMLFCRGKHKDAFELWTLQVENPLTLPSTQQKIAFSLGQCYCTGTGTKKDALKALEFLKLAARLGNVDAEIALGRCLRYDLCEDENATSFAASAVRHFTAAAENGSAEGRYELGLCYLQGAGSLRIDAAEAMRQFNTAAELGSVEAQYKIGQLYMGDFDKFGAGGPAGSVSAKEASKRIKASKIPHDEEQALEWFLKCKEQGYALGARRYAKLKSALKKKERKARAAALAAKEQQKQEADTEGAGIASPDGIAHGAGDGESNATVDQTEESSAIES